MTVIYIGDTQNYGASGGIRGYAIGTTSCNIGTTPVNWCDNLPSGCSGLTAAQHPVIAQNMYRLLDGRFEQIGMSWLKHGFVSTNSTDPSCLVGHSCASPPRGGNELGVGCTDTYGAGLNGSRPMGMRSEVNSTTGVFPFPETQVNPTLIYEQRIKVPEAELALPGASYWVEGQYIADNDAVVGNGFNNASYRSITVSPSTFNLSFAGSTIREKTAIQAWKTADPAVETFDEDFCSAPKERFEVARKVTVVDGDTWHYEYVVRNLNSDHAAGAFSVDFPDGTPIANVGFNDIEHHSGEPYATTDWTSASMRRTVPSAGSPRTSPPTRTPTPCAGRRCSTSGSTPTPRRRTPSTPSTSSNRSRLRSSTPAPGRPSARATPFSSERRRSPARLTSGLPAAPPRRRSTSRRRSRRYTR